jgi:glycosyltransferase involved in cell wall biosynthesis
MKLFLDFEPGLDVRPTGIAQMTFGIAQAMLKAFPKEDIFFFSEESLLPHAYVEHILSHKDGTGVDLWHNKEVERGSLHLALEKYRNEQKVGIYTNIKRVRDRFDYEVSIVADLVYLMFPQFLYQEAVHYYSSQILQDLLSSDLVLAISHTTRVDCEQFFSGYMGRCETVYLGCDIPFWEEVEPDQNILDQYGEYYLILGTREPRKNLDLVHLAIEQRPDLFDGANVVFVGKQGWGDNDGLPPASNVHFLDFVTFKEKVALLRNAKALLYPSLYEGFGLPIVEANRLGTPVICSLGGSCPEVADPKTTYYFDPTDVESFCDAIKASADNQLDNNEKRALSHRTRKFSWDAYVVFMSALIKTGLEENSTGAYRKRLALYDQMVAI